MSRPEDRPSFFHHPDLSLTVIRRTATNEMLHLLFGFGELLLTRGRAASFAPFFSSNQAYWSAAARLRRAGLIVNRGSDVRQPTMVLTDEAVGKLPDALNPQRLWKRKWNGLWYLLMYDIPEADRRYRNTIRSFLKRLRMGCFQKSAYVSPHDIRPEYHDLINAVAIDLYACLFESRTVLGKRAADIVKTAWPVEDLARVQAWYCEVAEDLLRRVEDRTIPNGDLLTVAREDASAYLTAMSEDPFLPKPLWPSPYYGKRAFDLHKRVMASVARRL